MYMRRPGGAQATDGIARVRATAAVRSLSRTAQTERSRGSFRKLALPAPPAPAKGRNRSGQSDLPPRSSIRHRRDRDPVIPRTNPGLTVPGSRAMPSRGESARWGSETTPYSPASTRCTSRMTIQNSRNPPINTPAMIETMIQKMNISNAPTLPIGTRRLVRADPAVHASARTHPPQQYRTKLFKHQATTLSRLQAPALGSHDGAPTVQKRTSSISDRIPD